MTQTMEYLESPGDYERIAAHRDAIIDFMRAVQSYSDCNNKAGREELAHGITRHGFKVQVEHDKDVILADDEPLCLIGAPPRDNTGRIDCHLRSTEFAINHERDIERFTGVSDWTSRSAIEILLSSEAGKNLLTHVKRISWVMDLNTRGLNEDDVEGRYPHLYIDRFTLRRLTQQKLIALTLEQQVNNLTEIMQAPSGIAVRKTDKIERVRDRLMHKDEVLNPEARYAQRVTMKREGQIEINRPLPTGALTGLIGTKVEDVIEGALFQNTDLVITDTGLARSAGNHITVLTTDNNQHDKLVKIER